MGKFKPYILKDDFKPKPISIPRDNYGSNRRYYIKQGLALFGVFVCLFLLILDIEWMAGRL